METVGQGVKNMFKVNGECQWRRSVVFIINFEHISHLVLVFLFLILIW